MIKIENISFDYSTESIFKRASVEIYKNGQIIGLMGRSGSGKSTLLNLIAGFLKLLNGEVFIDDRNITNLKPQDRNIGYVFQDYALFPNLKVRENIQFGLKVQKLPKSEIDRKVSEVAQLLEINSILDSSVNKISGGQKQRVALARSIAVSPKVLLLDEVFSAIDNNLKPALRKNIRDLLKKLNITAVLVSHSFEDITSVCDSICFIENKTITKPASVADIIANPPNYNIASLIGLENVFYSSDSNQRVYIPNEALSTQPNEANAKLSKLSEIYKGSLRYEVYKYGKEKVLFPHSGSDQLYLDETKIQILND